MINFIFDSNNKESLSRQNYKKIKTVVKNTIKLEGQKFSKIELSVIFTSSEKIKKINSEYREVNKTTDVLSFPNIEYDHNKKIDKFNYNIEYNKSTKKVFIGEIFVNLQKVRQQAKEYAQTFNDELVYLIVHSVLHLFGYTHEDEKSKKQMRDREELVLKKSNIKRNKNV